MRGNTQALAGVCIDCSVDSRSWVEIRRLFPGVYIDCSVDSRSWVEIRRLLLVFALTAQWIPGRGWKYAGSCWCLH